MKQLRTDKIKNWQVAKKTRNVKAKPLVSIMVDKSVTNKFLVDTLEGKEPLGDGAIICIGEGNDIWQQMPKNLLKKYDVREIDNDGWMICEPKPDNAVNCVEITNILTTSIMNMDFEWEGSDAYFIVGEWGELLQFTKDDEVKIQKAEIGDFICQNRETPSDVWIVRRKIFLNTYSIIS